jgi:triosephosphate isomerase
MVAALCQYVILGHSERRAYFGETDSSVKKKVHTALSMGLKPIVCVGETLDENETGMTKEVVTRQILSGLADISLQVDDSKTVDLIIAYEPVWAIGTGRAATSAGANQVIADIIRPALGSLFGEPIAQIVRVLYGGSVKADNASDFFSQPDIDGALVGGASLKVSEFIQITQSAAE